MRRMQVEEILSLLDTIAPFDTAQPWDNVGLMVGDPKQEISSIVVSLDPSFEAISFTQKKGAELIITHHPLLFHPLNSINLQENTARKISMLLSSGISLLSMHTNLDIAEGGVADVLAEKLKLQDVENLGFFRTGTIGDSRPVLDWSKALPFDPIRLVDAGVPVNQVGVCPGSGMDYWRDAFAMGCDTYVTGDVRYHAAFDAFEAGMNIVDLGHFGTEEIMIKPFMEKLQHRLTGVDIRAYEGRDVFTWVKGE